MFIALLLDPRPSSLGSDIYFAPKGASKKDCQLIYKHFAPSGAKAFRTSEGEAICIMRCEHNPSAYADGTDFNAHLRWLHAAPAKHAR